VTRRNERGSASIIMLGVLAVALVLCAALARLGGAAVSAARAQTAADAAALAAADQLALGHGATAARRTADAAAHENGARLVSCRCSGVAAEVEIEITGRARARARAEVDFSRARVP
jgi:secretion/DNA translocation related TadE-like protein